jgi:hypothetical protein
VPPGPQRKPCTVEQLPPFTGTTGRGLPGLNWTLVLRRRPAYTDAYELICWGCGDDPDLDYRDVSPQLRRIRGPYLIAAGLAAYRKHMGLYHVGPVTWTVRT